MSSVGTPPGLWSVVKTIALTGHTRHRRRPIPVTPGFKAPAASLNLSFGPTALAAAIARTATLRNAPIELLTRWRNSALEEVELMIADGATFSLSPHFEFLADTERTFFAARIGSGITDIMMNALGYTWRDNAACLSSTLDPRADFIYAGGSALGYGVVLAEAHGSFANNVSNAMIGRRAKGKYLRQVRPYISAKSPHGPVIHGYSIAFGSRPGTPDSFLNLAETQIRKPRGKPPAPPSPEALAVVQTTSTPLALATYRSNFGLMDAVPIVAWIDRVRAVTEYSDDRTPVEFFRLPYAGRFFLACTDSLMPFRHYPPWLDSLWDHPAWWRHFARRQFFPRRDRNQFAGWFVMEEQACERFLDALSRMIRGGRERIPQQIELPSVDPVGFEVGEGPLEFRGSDSEYTYALFRDGLALLGTPPRRIAGHRTWLPTEGLGANQSNGA